MLILFASATSGSKIIAQNQTNSQRVISTAVPFLNITPSARSSGLGNASIAASPDANSMYFNASNLAFASYDFEVAMSYTSWLRSLGVNDIFLAYLSGYKRINKLQTLGFGLRYFSVGQMQYTDNQGNPLQTVRPHELALDIAYARQLGKHIAMGATVRYILSSLGNGDNNKGITMRPAHAFAVDLSLSYHKTIKIAQREAIIRAGLSISNIGSKINYTSNGEADYLPANFGTGGSLQFYIDSRNSITFLFDINKLLVPTPVDPYIEDETGQIIRNPEYDANADDVPDYKQQAVPASIFNSIADAPGGAQEELNEMMFSMGLEYWYNQQFALRCGYFAEHATKGNRQFFTVGVGVNYKIVHFNFSYLVPTNASQTNPLDNTLRFSLLFKIGKQSSKNKA